MRPRGLCPLLVLLLLVTSAAPAGAVVRVQMNSLQTLNYIQEDSYIGDAASTIRQEINATAGDGDDQLTLAEVDAYERAMEDLVAQDIAQNPKTQRTFVDNAPLDILGYILDIWTENTSSGREEPVGSTTLLILVQRWTLRASEIDAEADRHVLTLTELEASTLVNASVPAGWRVTSTTGLVDTFESPGGRWVTGLPAVDGATVTVKYGRVPPAGLPIPTLLIAAAALALASASVAVYLYRRRRRVPEEKGLDE